MCVIILDMKTQRTYRLYLAQKTDHTVKADTPAKALRELVAAAGLELATQDGRYGRTTDGQYAAAMLVDTSRVRYADHGTTRLLNGKEVR